MNMKGFAFGAVCGLAGGIAAWFELDKRFGYPINWWGIKKKALDKAAKKLLGDDYSVQMDYRINYRGYRPDEWPEARGSLKNYVEKQKDEKGEMVYSIMEVLGAEGIFDEGHTILDKLLERCCNYHRGAFGDGDACTVDEYDIRGETFYVYYLRGGDEEPGYVSAVEKRPVMANYCGTFITRSELDISEPARVLEDEEWGFIEDEAGRTEMTIEEYLDSKLK